MTRRPDASEYAEYYDGYVKLVPDGDIIRVLHEQLDEMLELLAGVPAEKAEYRYEPEKWSVKELIRHVIDVEWIFVCRALTFARSDTSALPGMDQDEFADRAASVEQSLGDMRVLKERYLSG